MEMTRTLPLAAAVLAALAVAGRAYADEPIPPPTPGWAGTTDIEWTNLTDGTPVYPKRVGILAYCADIAHNAGDTGLQANKKSVRDRDQKGFVQSLSAALQPTALQDPQLFVPPLPGFPNAPGSTPWFLDGPFSYLGQYGAQNIADYLAYDDGIDRLRDVQVIDGDLLLPTGLQLIRNFDIIIAYTDNKCGQPIPKEVANAAAKALTDFVRASTPAAPKKLILTGFAFSSSIGLGDAIFAPGLSPLRRGGPGLAECSRGAPCAIGSCANLTAPDGSFCSPQPPCPGCPVECMDQSSPPNLCGKPDYQPLAGPDGDFACGHMLPSVNGPTSSSWATALTPASLDPGATLCFNYDRADGTPSPVPFLAINAARTIIAVNSFPADRTDIQKFWYGCMLGNMVDYLSGDTTRCSNQLCR